MSKWPMLLNMIAKYFLLIKLCINRESKLFHFENFKMLEFLFSKKIIIFIYVF